MENPNVNAPGSRLPSGQAADAVLFDGEPSRGEKGDG
jgi:hypothetical protein